MHHFYLRLLCLTNFGKENVQIKENLTSVCVPMEENVTSLCVQMVENVKSVNV